MEFYLPAETYLPSYKEDLPQPQVPAPMALLGTRGFIR